MRGGLEGKEDVSYAPLRQALDRITGEFPTGRVDCLDFSPRGPPLLQLSPEQIQRLSAAPVGHLSTVSREGFPHVIPVCFALDLKEDSSAIYIALDQKPKRASLTRLRRVRNILENPRVALVIDHYDEDWTQLWYILLTGTAQLLNREPPAPHPEPVEGPELTEAAHPELVEGRRAIHLLRQKYPQYRHMDIDDNPVIRITPQRAVAWSCTAP